MNLQIGQTIFAQIPYNGNFVHTFCKIKSISKNVLTVTAKERPHEIFTIKKEHIISS